MVEKPIAWSEGAILKDHSRRKHKILREYFARYLAVRCQYPQQTRFRLAVIDGFAGGGRYQCGASGSPLIFVEELMVAVEAFNLRRSSEGMASLDIECLLVLNEYEDDVVEMLKGHMQPILAAAKEKHSRLHIRVEYLNDEFEKSYSQIKGFIEQGRFRSVLFNLDQCGHSLVDRATLIDIMRSYESAEIFYTFMIESLLAFLRKDNPIALTAQLSTLGLQRADLSQLEEAMSKQSWLGLAERIVFSAFQNCAPFVSPFSINNPGGWRYWLIHFANSYRARQEYNNVLHQNSSTQAHFGRSGLHMLSYDPEHDAGGLYLFDVSGRTEARNQLVDDIPRLVSEFGDAVSVSTFY
jgi:three-Cys-motif partner protein